MELMNYRRVLVVTQNCQRSWVIFRPLLLYDNWQHIMAFIEWAFGAGLEFRARITHAYRQGQSLAPLDHL